MKIFITIFLVVVFLFIQHRIWLSNDGFRSYMELQTELKVQKEKLLVLESRNKVLRAEVKDLKSQLVAVEERARNDLGMIKENETFYFVPEKTL